MMILWIVIIIALMSFTLGYFLRSVFEKKTLPPHISEIKLELTGKKNEVLVKEIKNITFYDIFTVQELQELQDLFSKATGVASLITLPDGTPLTKPSNFCDLCKIIRQTKKGLKNCQASDAALGRVNPGGPIFQPCLSGGLWDGGASITVGGKHVANWLIGQVRDSTQSEDKIITYAKMIDGNESEMLEAFRKVPSMSKDHFEIVSKTLFAFAQKLSEAAYQNILQARFISEQQKVERALSLAKKNAEAANEAKSLFLANVSHEMRTPLNSVLGMVELLSESELDMDQKEQITIAKRNGSALLRLIEDVLDLSKIEKGNITIYPRPYEIRELVSDIIISFSYNEKIKNEVVTLVSHVDKKIPSWVEGDSSRVRQILVNLISNSLKFSDQGEIKLSVHLKDEKTLLFVISDHGIGIPEDKISNLFQRFMQADSSITRKYGGTGIGLSLTKEIVDLMGGTISCESQRDVGTSFFVELPLVISLPQEPVKSKNGTNHAIKSMKILLVDDSKDNRILIKRYLKNVECELIEAENGQQAIDFYKNSSFDIILMDISMPVMDGHEATKRIRALELQNKVTSPIIIVALTAYSFEAEKRLALESGFNHFLTKPINKYELLDFLEKLL